MNVQLKNNTFYLVPASFVPAAHISRVTRYIWVSHVQSGLHDKPQSCILSNVTWTEVLFLWLATRLTNTIIDLTWTWERWLVKLKLAKNDLLPTQAISWSSDAINLNNPVTHYVNQEDCLKTEDWKKWLVTWLGLFHE